MNGAGKKHTLRFDPRTELLLLVLANIVAFTQHSVWVEITWVVFLLLLIVACGCQKSAGKHGKQHGATSFLSHTSAGVLPAY